LSASSSSSTPARRAVSALAARYFSFNVRSTSLYSAFVSSASSLAASAAFSCLLASVLAALSWARSSATSSPSSVPFEDAS
jgi:hypothetical protein